MQKKDEQMKIELAKYMMDNYIKLINEHHRPVSITELADALEMDRSLVGRYLEGKIAPTGDGAIRIANFFRDDRIFDILGISRPKLSRHYILSMLRDDSVSWDDAFLSQLEEEIQHARARRSVGKGDPNKKTT